MSLRGSLDVRPGEDAHLVLRRATVLDPVAGIEGVHDVVLRDGEIAELAAPGEAEVVYALRLQNERMRESFVPSLREYAASFQIDSRRLNPRQLLMHPGPVNRGVELSGEAIDSP